MAHPPVNFKLSDNSTITATELAKKIGTTRQAARHRLNRTNNVTKLFLPKNKWKHIDLGGSPIAAVKEKPRKKIKKEVIPKTNDIDFIKLIMNNI
jgi:ABC-type iron transport system FetAB permease component